MFFCFLFFSTGWRTRVLRNLFVSWSLVFNFVSHPKKSQRKRDRVYPGWKNRNRLPVFFLVLVVVNEHLRQPVETAFSFPGVPISKAAFSGCLFPIWGKTGKRKIPKGKSSVPRMRVELRRQKPDHGTGAEHDSMSDADPVDILFSHKGTGGSSGSCLRWYTGRRWQIMLTFVILQKSVIFE